MGSYRGERDCCSATRRDMTERGRHGGASALPCAERPTCSRSGGQVANSKDTDLTKYGLPERNRVIRL